MTRKTKETEITAEISLNGGDISIDTGIGFFDHMLTSLSFFAGWGLTLSVSGDLHVDAHHTVEDAGIVLGAALLEELSENRTRFGSAYIPMDEALAFAAIDIGGRALLKFDAEFPAQNLNGYDTELTKEFFRAFSQNAKLTLHLSVDGENTHHMTEALFKAAGAALKIALTPRGASGIASTKGVL